MKSIYCFLFSLFVLFVSCKKNDNDNDNPPPATREWFKLQTKINTTQYTTGIPYRDSSSIGIDSANKKIIIKEYSSSSGGKDSSTETYTYNNDYQLVLYEHVDTYDYLFISRMEFVRDANGQVTKVLSGYKNGLMASSEGFVKYDKRGDTTLITYLDSAKKHPNGYPDAQDFYQVALVGEKMVYHKDFPIKTAGQSDTSIAKFEYDASGNLVTETDQYSKTSTPIVYTYQRGSEVPKELQKFIAQLTGDLFWFQRSKFLFYLSEIGYDNYILGTVVQSIKKDNVAYLSFTNTFDASGNLTTISYLGTGGGAFGRPTITEQYKYRP